MVYLDVVFFLNFLVDFLLLLGTNRLSGFPPGIGRCAMAAVLGAVYGAMCLVPGFRFLGNLLWRLVSLGLMGMLAFGFHCGALRRCGVFVILCMTLGGVAVSLGKGDLVTVALSAGLVWLLCGWAFGGQIGGREYVPVEITWQGKQASIVAMRDSGNTLRDPITGEQILVISSQVARQLTGLSREELCAPLETLTRRPFPGLRLVPYRTVGQRAGMLLAMRMEDVKIGCRKQSAIVAFAPEGLDRGDMYQALTGGVL